LVMVEKSAWSTSRSRVRTRHNHPIHVFLMPGERYGTECEV
jgi:hypothetical protein